MRHKHNNYDDVERKAEEKSEADYDRDRENKHNYDDDEGRRRGSHEGERGRKHDDYEPSHSKQDEHGSYENEPKYRDDHHGENYHSPSGKHHEDYDGAERKASFSNVFVF